jgi:hypothetical protein
VSFWSLSLAQNNATIKLDPVRETQGVPWLPKNSNIAEVDVIISNGPANSHVDFSLSNVTDWEGYCMNAGSQSDADKDLKLNEGDQDDSIVSWDGGGQTISASWIGDAPGAFPLKVRAYDYGAYGKVTAKLYTQDPEPPSSTVSIPRDKNNNWIADGWRVENYDAAADDETGPGGNTYPGDGFSVFEEYRGFMVKGNHVDTDPTQKDVFVYSEVTVGSVQNSVGYATELPHPPFIEEGVHKINLDNMGPTGDNYRRMDYQGEDVPGGASTKREALYVRPNTDRTLTTPDGWPILGIKLAAADATNLNQIGGYDYKEGDLVIFMDAFDACLDKAREETYNSLLTFGISTQEAAERCYHPSDADKVKLQMKTIGHEIGHGVGLSFPDHHKPNGFCIMDQGTVADWDVDRYVLLIGSGYQTHHNSEYNLK